MRTRDGVVIASPKMIHGELIGLMNEQGFNVDQPMEYGWLDLDGFHKSTKPEWPGTGWDKLAEQQKT